MEDLWIYCSSEQVAFGLSAAVYRMGDPEGHVSDVTSLYSSPVQHPTTLMWRLRMCAAGFYIHPRCNLEELDPFMQPYVDQGLMTQADIDKFHEDVAAARGGTVVGVEVLPAIFLSTALNFQQMVDDGWFPEYQPS